MKNRWRGVARSALAAGALALLCCSIAQAQISRRDGSAAKLSTKKGQISPRDGTAAKLSIQKSQTSPRDGTARKLPIKRTGSMMRAMPPASRNLESMIKLTPAMMVEMEILSLPDIRAHNLRFSPTHYVPPRDVTATVTLTNDGDEPAGAFVVRWRTMYSVYGDQHVSGLAPGASTNVSFTRRFTGRPVETTIVADCYNEVAEWHAHNNSVSGTPLVSAGACDGYVDDIWLEWDGDPVRQPVTGEPVRIYYRIGFLNTIDTVGLPVGVNLYVDGVMKHSTSHVVPANGTRQSYTDPTLSNGEHGIEVRLIVTPEANTANNQMTKHFTWRKRASRPYRFTYYGITAYDRIGGGGNLSHSVNEVRRFYWKMDDHGHTCSHLAENEGVNWRDWADGANAEVNRADMAYFSGHGNTNGPWYSSNGWDGSTHQMKPANYRWGKNAAGQPTLRWCTWAACSTLYDGVQDSSHINWWDGADALSRWFQTYEGLHSIMGMRSLGWEGNWYEYDFPWWDEHDTRDRAAHYVNLLHDGYTFHEAWFIANRRTVYDHLDRGFEAAALAANTEGVNYNNETFTNPFPDYVGTPGGYNYHWYRVGSPSW